MSEAADIFNNAGEQESAGYGSLQALTLDVERYQAYLDDPALSDEDKRELIAALWSIMVSFVDLGFGIHPLQACGQIQGLSELIEAPLEAPVIPSTHTTNSKSTLTQSSAKHKES